MTAAQYRIAVLAFHCAPFQLTMLVCLGLFAFHGEFQIIFPFSLVS